MSAVHAVVRCLTRLCDWGAEAMKGGSATWRAIHALQHAVRH